LRNNRCGIGQRKRSAIGVKMKHLVALMALISLGVQPGFSQERSISGRVVNTEGMPVANVSVATFWRANGSSRKSDGTEFDLQDKAQLLEYWGRLGQMEPSDSTETKVDGTFTISPRSRDRALFALTADRNYGCISEVAENAYKDSEIVMRLTRLVTVTAEFRTSVKGKSFDWCHAYVELLPDEKNPLANNRLISCGSFDRRFEARLPPGDYQLDAYAVSDSVADIIDLRVQPAPKFTVRSTDTELDIGVLDLTVAPPSREVLERESKQAARWNDYTKHYGEPAPDWYSVDGRGIDHQKNLQSLKGKWVILDFWGISCAPCLGRGIPKMMDFYERNAKSRERFEVIGICIDFTGEIDRMSELDKALSSIETHVWKGKKIPFPIVLDNTFNTWERYGIPGLGTAVLVDPDGRIVEGDESTLQAILDKAEP
jgi:thiol-disulfide isomerase/thioredoxin